ncbi:MAG: 16S rRNA (adenine(1518)-N(6)/adenine(1519)-N(6))-dimethyltransferase RsmA [Oscillospiraceae bacterium]|jgi:16S rRNA (adenine1518-N6/adenine1519-N6)-dimethyltransferase|nr:16S rRNA (adenine(1518)-N(6)/adenine(1519)-N(6))-dimethyltransferase RsmA [Oscillospiraceae bacterium]
MSENELRALLTRHGFRFSKAMGQNFLVDDNVPVRIADGAGVTRDSHVLEIGPGIGALTSRLCERAGFVTAVELDLRLAPILAETLGAYANVEVVQGDALRMDLGALMAARTGVSDLRVCANLPYNITTPILQKLLQSGVFRSITVMVQREVARRICAAPGTSDYGAFSVFAQYHTAPEVLFDVPPECFVPRPQVTSSVVRLDVRENAPPEVGDASVFFRVVRAAFAQRRKTLVNALCAVFGGQYSKEELAAIVRAAGIAELARGETLGIPEFARLARLLETRG